MWLQRRNEIMAINRRKYADYKEYIQHQKEKTLDPARRERLTSEELYNYRVNAFIEKFVRFTNNVPCQQYSVPKIGRWTKSPYMDVLKKGSSSLCLGARMGEDDLGLKELGIEATGLDLVPYPPLVLEGDFHDIPFGNNSFDFIYTNSLDHGFDLEKIFVEVTRVLKPSGFLFIDFAPNTFGKYESIQIEAEKDIINKVPSDLIFMESQKFLGTGSPKPGLVQELYFTKAV